MKLWAMPCGATQDGRVMVESSDKTWSIGEGNGKPLQYSCLVNPMNSMKMQNNTTLKDELPTRGSSQTRDQTHISCVSWIAGRFFITEPSRKPYTYHTYIVKEKEIEWDAWESIADRAVLGLILPSFSFFTFSKFSVKKNVMCFKGSVPANIF